MVKGLVVGRFQLVGNHHVDLFRQIKEFHEKNQNLEELDVAVAVPTEDGKNNPFSPEECWEMIGPVAESAAKEMGIPLKHMILPDINDADNYASYVSDIFDFDGVEVVVFSSNQHTNSCFRDRTSFKVVEVEERLDQHSTELREKYLKDGDLHGLVPDHVLKFLEQTNARHRLRD